MNRDILQITFDLLTYMFTENTSPDDWARADTSMDLTIPIPKKVIDKVIKLKKGWDEVSPSLKFNEVLSAFLHQLIIQGLITQVELVMLKEMKKDKLMQEGGDA